MTEWEKEGALLPPIARSAAFSDKVMAECDLTDVLNVWLSLHNWKVRADLIEGFLSDFYLDFASDNIYPPLRIVTVLLEQNAERHIRCIDAAMAYRLTVHPPWRAVAQAWLDSQDFSAGLRWSMAHPIFYRWVRSLSYDEETRE